MAGLRRSSTAAAATSPLRSTSSSSSSFSSSIFSCRVVALLLLVGVHVINLPTSSYYNYYDKRGLVVPGSGTQTRAVYGDRNGGGNPIRLRKTSGSSSVLATPADATASMCDSSSPWEGRMGLNDYQKSIALRKDDVVRAFRSYDGHNEVGEGLGIVDRLSQVRHLTVERYEKYMLSPPGREHYALLHYLVDNYGSAGDQQHPDCRHVVDIGTRYVASSLALGSSTTNPTKVWTFDLPQSQERVQAYRGKTEAQWNEACKAAGVEVAFHNLNLLEISDADFRRYMSTWLIVLDTAHLPRTVPFEREFVQRLRSVGYTGLLVLDDIHLNDEMREWWIELKEGATNTHDGHEPYTVYDVTAIGHVSGTGLIDFSNQISVFV